MSLTSYSVQPYQYMNLNPDFSFYSGPPGSVFEHPNYYEHNIRSRLEDQQHNYWRGYELNQTLSFPRPSQVNNAPQLNIV